MAYKVIVSPFAHADEYDAYSWYEKQRVGLGDEFLVELEFAYDKITLNPENYSFIDERKELRDCPVKRFPYVIVYRIAGNTIEIISVHHFKKHPSKKYGNSNSKS